MSRCWSSASVYTTRRISRIEFGKSESQPPVPKPTWPKASRCANPAFLKESLAAMKP
ncbi:hypothetical protein D3C86_2238170 [compost metagenome]